MQIRKPSLLQRLVQRLGLDRHGYTTLSLGRQLVLTSDADRIVADVKAFTQTTASPVGYLNAYQVPAGKRYLVHAIYIYRASGDRNCDTVRLYDVTGGFATLSVFTAASNKIVAGEHFPVPLDAGGYVGINITGGTTDGTWGIQLWATEEDIA